jgi:HD superfamily phosphohydrolase
VSRIYEIRDPIHGFIKLDEWERDIINQPAFQRLRRIRQLAWTDMVYPGATHSRFEHSLGVMHIATRLFDALCQRNEPLLASELNYNNAGLQRQRQLVRLAALLHDIGHGPFSHAAEEILPLNSSINMHYTHEQYSAAIVELSLKDVIENHPVNQNNYHITVDEIKDLFLEKPSSGRSLVWRVLIAGQMDADRMDYLLRDACHTGVNYGKYDLDRLVSTVTLCEEPESQGYLIGIEDGGIKDVEGLLIARYMMFTQLYFHKTRVIYDYHYVEAMKEILKKAGGHLPPPDTAENIQAYLKWDDWRVLGAIVEGQAKEHGEILRNRNHYRLVYWTPEVPSIEELEELERLQSSMNGLGAVMREAGKSWYKFEKEEIWVRSSAGSGVDKPIQLSRLSPVVKGLETVRQSRIYVPLANRKEAEQRIRASSGGGKEL